tara:strand:+ start:1402 stop:3051 length:1650 start_codon:yes stop_codon:yes gene_type:complete
MPAQGWGKRGACPSKSCGSSDACVEHSEGYSYCFACKTKFENYSQNNKNYTEKKLNKDIIIGDKYKNNKLSSIAIKDRNISLETTKFYNVKCIVENNKIVQHQYPYHTPDGTLIGEKNKLIENKKFWSSGDLKQAGLFGEHLFSGGAPFITICEGEIDAMSVYEMGGRKYPSVSIKNGAHSALKNCKESLKFLNSFKNIVICFDNDKQGQEASKEVATLFEPNKCKIVSLNLKDASEYLQAGKREEFMKRWWNAKPYTPAGIINLADLGDSLYDESECDTCLYPWNNLNEKTYGLRTGELTVFTSGSGMGKSSIIRELMHHIMTTTKDNIGILALEESTRNTALNIMSVEANARLYIKEIREQFTIDQLKEYQNKTINNNRFFAFDHFGSIHNDEILDRIRYMAKALDCKWIFLDHLSILVSGQEDNGNERKLIDMLMTKLRSLVQETGIGLILVSHLRRPIGDRGHENGREISLSQLRGSGGIGHLSDMVIGLERNQQADDEDIANTTTIRVIKNRYAGDLGVGCYLYYDKDTGRMSEVANPYGDRDE